jgi:GNAT superfamily N-acetyltransferase
MFREYHYLNKGLAPFVKCFAAFLGGTPVGFVAVQTVKFGTTYNRVSRLVVLPDYQGVGIGRKLLTFVAEYYKKQSHIPFLIVTSNPQLIRGGLKGWRITRAGRSGKINNASFLKQMHGAYRSGAEDRLTVSLEYLGVPKS